MQPLIADQQLPLEPTPKRHIGATPHIIVIGSGPVGMAFVDAICKKKPNSRISLFGDERVAPYNRVQLSALLAGDIQRADIDLPMPDQAQIPNFNYHAAGIKAVDRKEQCVIDVYDRVHHYDTLIFATGARAHIPNIPGKEKNGVYQFRSLKDTESLAARLCRSRHVVVLGGGLLGLEAAKGLLRARTQVTVIQQGSHLMNRQLDEKAAELLMHRVKHLGIHVITNSGVRHILGNERVSGVKTRDGKFVSCDTVLVCAGIKPNVELARAAELKVRTGIITDDQLQTSDKNIFAIGECCEHGGITYGLVNPGFEQAKVAADVINKGDAIYKGSLSISRLKVVGESVTSMGEVVERGRLALQTELVFHDKNSQCYRKIFLLKGRVSAAVGFGEWPEAQRVQSAFQQNKLVYPWQRWLFRQTGRLWLEKDSNNVSQWATSAEVCQCKSVSKGELVDAIHQGADNIPALQQRCGAGMVCGSCVPLLDELLADKTGRKRALIRETAWRLIGLFCLIALFFIGLMIFMPEAKVSDSVQTSGWFEAIWNDKFYKQVTGFSLLGLSVMGLMMSLRKRIDASWLGKFAYWRLAHITLGVLAAATLLLHTGFHLGANLNLLLMSNFLAIMLFGVAAAAMVSLSHTIAPHRAKPLRKLWNWIHIVISWPLPALLAVHVFSVYYF